MSSSDQQYAAYNSQALPDGAYLIAGVLMTEKGQVSQLQRDQIKIYSNGRFMYAFNNAMTGNIDVGGGMASWRAGVMVEVPRVNHDGPVDGLSFDVAIKQTVTGFEQTILGFRYDDGRVVDMVEDWHVVSTARSDFDGLWQLETSSKDGVEISGVAETKMIGGGHFIWLRNGTRDGQPEQDFAFGPWTIDKAGHASEEISISARKDRQGSVYPMRLELINKDCFVQTSLTDTGLLTQSFKRI